MAMLPELFDSVLTRNQPDVQVRPGSRMADGGWRACAVPDSPATRPFAEVKTPDAIPSNDTAVYYMARVVRCRQEITEDRGLSLAAFRFPTPEG